MKNLLVAMLLLACFSCGNQSSQSESENEVSDPDPVETEESPELSQLKVEASRLRAGGSIKTVELIDGKAIINYVKNYDEYKKLNPQSTLKKEMLDDYWSGGDAIEKALVDGPARIMRKLDYVNAVEVVLHYKGKEYVMAVSKKDIEDFTGHTFSSIVEDWSGKFSDPYVYSKEGRDKYFKQFVKIK